MFILTKMPTKLSVITMSSNKIRRTANTFGWKISWMMLLVLTVNLPLLVIAKECSYNEGITEANCSRRNLQAVPWSLHKSIVSLDLSGNKFPVLANHSFINYMTLRYLSLSNNSIVEIMAGAFHGLDYLSTLDLSNNKLTKVPSDALKMVAYSLEILHLGGNSLHIFPSGVFSDLRNLKELDLTGNAAKLIKRDAFLGLKSLKVLRIRHMGLSSLPPDSFDDFSQKMTKVELYDNMWDCDCRMRWLWTWLNATDPSVWKTPGYSIRCDKPAFIRGKDITDLSLDYLACDVEMKMGGSTRYLDPGTNATLQCKYSSVPEADLPVWRKNNLEIDVDGNPHKYSISSWSIEDKYGLTHVNELKIKKFGHKDIGKYDCLVRNVRGHATTEYKVTLTGVDFDSVVNNRPEQRKASTVVDTKSIIIAGAVVGGIIALIAIVILIFCCVNRVQRDKEQKKRIIQEKINKHFSESEAGSQGDSGSPNGKAHKVKAGLDGSLDDTVDDHSKSMDSTYKPPLDQDEVDHMYPFEQPGSPNGHTYVSYGSELTEPAGEFLAHQPLYTQAQPPPHYESSHAGSATPLLDRNTPSLYDSVEEPIEDYSQFPVYDSMTNSLQHPKPPSNNGYGGGYDFLPHRQNSVASYASTINRNNGGVGDQPYHQYPPSCNGSMPRTPGSTRSAFTFGPRSVDGDVSPLNDLYGGSSQYHQSRPAGPPPQPHPHYNTYQYVPDYRDPTYATAATPPPHRMTPNTKKSMSVGNLGYSPVPTSSSSGTGPRKPPRIYQSREYMELTPQDSNSDYITSSDAQNYSQSYGITPGTPV